MAEMEPTVQVMLQHPGECMFTLGSTAEQGLHDLVQAWLQHTEQAGLQPAYFRSTINNAEDFSMYLLEEAHVATVGGNAFGTPECIRLSYAASEAQLQEALSRISKAVAALQ